MIKIWVTKYALTKGIIETEGTVNSDTVNYGLGGYRWACKSQWARTEEAAIVQAEEMRVKKISSLEKQIKKLEKLTF